MLKMGRLRMLILLSLIGLCGCGTASETGSSGLGESEEQPLAVSSEQAAVEVEVANLEEGLVLMSEAVKQFKSAVESGEREEASKLNAQMTGVWKIIEQELEALYPDQHLAVDKALTQLTELSANSSANQDELVQADYALYQALRDLTQLQANP